MKQTATPLLWNNRSAVALAAVAFLFTAAIIAFQISERQGVFDESTVVIFYRLFLFTDYPAAFIHLAILAIALLPPVQRVAVFIAAKVAIRPHVAAVVSAFVFAMGATYLYMGHPLAMDEYVPVMQSRIFAVGRLLGTFPHDLVDWLIFPSFQNYFIHVSHVSGEFASTYWPGFAMLLTPFTLAGVPWLLNPLLAGLAVIVIFRLAFVLTADRYAAGIAAALTVASPAFFVNAISFYSMTAHLLCNAIFALLLLQPTPKRAALAGLIGGLALTLHNPLPHMLFTAPWILWLMWRQDRWRNVAALLLGYLPFVVIVGFGWHALVSRLTSPSGAESIVSEGLVTAAAGKLSSVLVWPTASLIHVRLIALAKIWIWAVPALLPLAAIGFWRARRELAFRLMMSSAVITLVGYLFVPADQGHGWGYRYFHSAWFVLPVFAAAALARSGISGVAKTTFSGSALAPFGAAAALASALLLVPYFGFQVRSFIMSHLDQMPRSDTGTARIVVINPYNAYYSQDLAQNDPFLRDPVIRMVTRGRHADREMIARHFPDLVLLESDYRGWVWGYPKGVMPSTQSDVGSVAGDDKR